MILFNCLTIIFFLLVNHVFLFLQFFDATILIIVLHLFEISIAVREVSTPLWRMFRSPPQSMWDITIRPLRGPASLLAHSLMSMPHWGSTFSMTHRLVSGSDSICNSPSLPLADIVLFGLSLKNFKTHLLGRGFHALIKNVSFSSPTNVWL